MKIQIKCLVTFIFFSFLLNTGFANIIKLDKDALKIYGEDVDVFFDPSNKISPFEIWNNQSLKVWEKSNNKIINFGNTHGAYWIKITLNAQESFYKKWDLVIKSTSIDYIDAYQIFENVGPRAIYRSGSKRSYSSRNIDHPYFIIPIDMFLNSETILLHIKNEGMTYLPIEIHPNNTLWNQLLIENLWNWLFYGGILAISIYHLLLFISVKDISFLFYSLFLASFLGLHFSLDGYLFQFIWSKKIGYYDTINSIFISLSLFFGILFINNFLNLKQKLPHIKTWSTYFAFLQLPLIPLIYFYKNINFITFPTILLILLIAIIVGFYLIFKGSSKAIIFILGWLLFSVSNFIIILISMSYLDTEIHILVLSKLSLFLNTFIQSMALSIKFRITNDNYKDLAINNISDNYFYHQLILEAKKSYNRLPLSRKNSDNHASNFSLSHYINLMIRQTKDSIKGKSVSPASLQDIPKNILDLLKNFHINNYCEFKFQLNKNYNNIIFIDKYKLYKALYNLYDLSISNSSNNLVTTTIRIKKSKKSNYLYLKIYFENFTLDINSIHNYLNKINPEKNHTLYGIYLSQELIKQLDGTLTIRKKTNHPITECHIKIPISIIKKETVSLSRKLNILIFNDNPFDFKVFYNLFEKENHSFIIESSPENILEKTTLENFDLLIINIESKKIIEFNNLMNNQSKKNIVDIPTIIITDNALEEIKNLKFQSCETITKPLSQTKIMRSVNKVLYNSNDIK